MARQYICQHCGQIFTPKAVDRTTYCSRECCFAHWREQALERNPQFINIGYCVICGRAYHKRPATQYTCSPECRLEYQRWRGRQNARLLRGPKEPITCTWCGKVVIHEYGRKFRLFCSRECQRAAADSIRKIRRKLRIGGKNTKAISLQRVYKRDGGKCQICGKHVNLKYQFPDMRSGSIDHIIPLSRGGVHDWWNVQLAHLGCNINKTDKVEDGKNQLQLAWRG